MDAQHNERETPIPLHITMKFQHTKAKRVYLKKFPKKKDSELVQSVKNMKAIRLFIGNATFKIQRETEIINLPV